MEPALARRPKTQAELYEHLNRLFVVLRRSAADGRELEPAAGFLPTPQTGRIHTVVPAVDAADTLRAVTSDGMVHPLTRLVVADRRQQWAIVQGPPAAGEALVMAAYDKARKINLNKGGFARMSWEFPVPKTAGVYRADLTVDARPYWRGFVRINP